MKLWFLLPILLFVCMPARSARSESLLLEAEEARLSGQAAVIRDPAASGGLSAGELKAEGDRITFLVTLSRDGEYDVTVTSRGIGGEKINLLLADGAQVGSFRSPGNVYGEDTVRGVYLEKGSHELTVDRSWGWARIDCVRIVPAEAVAQRVYEAETPLIDPAANESARALYAYIRESFGRKVLTGQVSDGGVHGAEFEAVRSVTGHYPAVLGMDMMDYTPCRAARGARSTSVEKAIEFDRLGGIVTLCWHWSAPDRYLKDGTDANGNPRWWGGFYTANNGFDLKKALDGGDPDGLKALDADILAIGKELKRLDDAGVPVLWRPLHEASGGWFWWGAAGPESYKALWIRLYDTLTGTVGCHNLIWVWNGQNRDWYPGDEYVDIIGEDIYASAHDYGAQAAKFRELTEYPSSPKVIALTENGVVPDPDRMQKQNTLWAWFCTWSGEFVRNGSSYSERYTEAEQLKKVYSHPLAVTLDTVDWKRD